MIFLKRAEKIKRKHFLFFEIIDADFVADRKSFEKFFFQKRKRIFKRKCKISTLLNSSVLAGQ